MSRFGSSKRIVQSPNPVTLEETHVATIPTRRRGRIILLGGLSLLVIAALLSIPALPTLTGLLFPPMPPLPPDTREISHETEKTGRDHWIYATASETCALIDFYIDAAATCAVQDGLCPQTTLPPPNDTSMSFRCDGIETFANFAMRWDAFQRSAGQLEVRRIINWFSTTPPQPFPTDNPLARR